jgi:hypothetical protein
MLFESGEPPAAVDGPAGVHRDAVPPSVRAALDRASALAAELDRALRSHRYDSVVELMREESRIIETVGDPARAEPVRDVAGAVEPLGGAARRCGRGRAVAVWAPPGRTAAVAAAVAGRGFRRIPFRVDLRGLEVE